MVDPSARSDSGDGVVVCRLFSRAPGWCAPDEPPVPTRHFWSPAVRVPARLARAWRGWRAARVAAAARGHRLAEFDNVLCLLRQFPDWYLLPEDASLGWGPEYHV